MRALHEADVDMQRESLEKLKEDKNIEAFQERLALIDALFRQGMNQILNPPKPVE